MPDDYHPLTPQRNPEDIDPGAIKADLEFLIERVTRLLTRQEQAYRPLYVMIGSAGLVILWIELTSITSATPSLSTITTKPSRSPESSWRGLLRRQTTV